MKKLTTADFINQSKQQHGDTYDYVDTVYLGAKLNVNIRCRIHGLFAQQAYIHKKGAGCPKCDISLMKTTDTVVAELKRVHGTTYDYSHVVYRGVQSPITISCRVHGPFSTTPSSHKAGTGCPTCAKERVGQKNAERGKKLFSITQQEMLSRCIAKHSDRYSYDKVVYINYYTPIIVICPFHGEFAITPDAHIHGTGCASCAHTQKFSNKALNWLTTVSKQQNIKIQHAANGGEITLPRTKIKVDGYCEHTNTVYEYHGSKWHGDPIIFLPTDKCHPFDKCVTAQELYNKTMMREQLIQSLGFNLIVMWESELDPAVIQRYSNEAAKYCFAGTV